MATTVELVPFTDYDSPRDLAHIYSKIISRNENRNVLRQDFPRLYPQGDGSLFELELNTIVQMRRRMEQRMGQGALAIEMSEDGEDPLIVGRALYRQYDNLDIGTGRPLTGPQMRMWLDQTDTRKRFGPQGVTLLRQRLFYLANECNDPNIKGTPWALIRPGETRTADIWGRQYFGSTFTTVGGERNWNSKVEDGVTAKRQLYVARFTLAEIRGREP